MDINKTQVASNYQGYNLSTNKVFHCLLILIIFSLLQGCATPKMPDKPVFTHPQPVLNAQLQARNDKLLVLYNQWQGTPYRLGGNSVKGIDCSAFVQQVYQAGFDVNLPRTTNAQLLVGQAVKQQATIGDLIFFRTGSKTRHVGIYINNNQFLHASTSKGVIISELNNTYWRKHYWQTRRVLSKNH